MLNPTEIYDNVAALAARVPTPEAFGLALMEAVGAPKGNSHALKYGRYTAEAIAERRQFADLLRAMKSFIDEVDGKE
jgi:hypothetical protein